MSFWNCHLHPMFFSSWAEFALFCQWQDSLRTCTIMVWNEASFIWFCYSRIYLHRNKFFIEHHSILFDHRVAQIITPPLFGAPELQGRTADDTRRALLKRQRNHLLDFVFLVWIKSSNQLIVLRVPCRFKQLETTVIKNLICSWTGEIFCKRDYTSII